MDNLPVIVITLLVIIIAIGVFTAVKKGAGGVTQTADDLQNKVAGEIGNIDSNIGGTP